MCALEREPDTSRPTRLDLSLPGYAVQGNSAAKLLGWWWKGLPNTPVPFYSINLHEVADENYAALVKNIQTQQVGMSMFLDRRFRKVFHFSVQSYRGKKRILWINRFEKPPPPLPDPDEVDVESAVESSAGGRAWFRLFKGLAEFSDAYDWWTVQELDSSTLFAANGDANASSPVVLDRLKCAPTRLPLVSDFADAWPERQLVELQATALPCYSVSVIDVSSDNYDRVLDNIKRQQAGLCRVLGEEYLVPHIYGANRYAGHVRILWINKLDGNPEAVASTVRDNKELWDECVALVDGYKWWASQDVAEEHTPRVRFYSKVEFIGSVLHALLFRR